MDACDAATSSICAFARSAMKRCPAGGMARSSVPTRYHEGMDRHPGGPEGPAYPAPLQGRWVAAITLAISGSTSAANASGNSSRSSHRSTPSLPSGLVNGTGRIAAGTRLPAKGPPDSKSCWMLSPSSGIHPLQNTSALTCSFPAAALDMTAPP